MTQKTEFDLGRKAAKHDRAIYGLPWHWDILRFFSNETDFGRGYWSEFIKEVTMTEKIETGRWMDYDLAQPFDGDIGDLEPFDSIDAAPHDGGAGVVIAPDDTRIYWED